RAATASTAAERSIRMRLASRARAAARMISGRPAPASTASVIAARAERSGAEGAGASRLRALSGSSEDPWPLDDDQPPKQHPDPDQSGQDVEREDRHHGPLEHAAVRAHRR